MASRGSGRGRGWRKRSDWDSLAESTRKRYRSAGINAERYARGDTRHSFESWVKHYSKMYAMDVEDIRIELRGKDRGKIMDAIHNQKRMEAEYMSGEINAARDAWLSRDDDLPEWMFYYHGAFS